NFKSLQIPLPKSTRKSPLFRLLSSSIIDWSLVGEKGRSLVGEKKERKKFERNLQVDKRLVFWYFFGISNENIKSGSRKIAKTYI
ncbi:MAG: hypothetical protein Q8803_02550, partial [Candidatus Phytoplasma australasiaticum]|nr:hypothetical protein [Candidatus Phytoplasma australasiaticum]